MSFRPKPWYFERECPVCTWSASSFCHNHPYFFAHAMWVKWWYHAKFQPFSEFISSAFQFQGHLAQKISKYMKNSKWYQKGLKIDDMASNGAYWMKKKVGSWNKFKKMKYLCNRWVFVRNPDTSKDSVRFVHELHLVFAVTLFTFLHMLCGWHDDTMPSFNLFKV